MTRKYSSHQEAWVEELDLLRVFGRPSSPRGVDTRELRWQSFAVAHPLTFPLQVGGRKFADSVAVLEATSLVGQFSVPELFTERVAKFQEFTDGGVFHGSYGQRIHGRLSDLVALLRRDPDSRQAVLTIYDSRSDLGAAKTDIPCTLTVQFMTSGRHLEMHVSMRSNDAWLGTPYDLQQFSVLQASVAQALGLIPGTYVHTVGSFHLYDRDTERAAMVSRLSAPAAPMSFPLWGCGDDIGDISRRARDLALGRIGGGTTEYEAWAAGRLIL